MIPSADDSNIKKLPNGELIRDALRTHHQAPAPTIETLYVIFKECNRWLKQYKKNKNGQDHATRVEGIKNAVIVELNRLQGSLGKALDEYKNPGLKPGPKRGLHKDFAAERAYYLKSNKGAAVAVSQVNSRHDAPAMMTVEYLEKFDLKSSPRLRMYYTNRVQRLRHLVTCSPKDDRGPRWVKIDGALAHSEPRNEPIATNMTYQLYAMDRYGNLFVDYDDAAHAHITLNYDPASKLGAATTAILARGKMNHSSFCAGRDVICAGMICFWQGQLLHIDNASGHYKPTAYDLYNAVGILKDAGAQMEYLRVGVHSNTSPPKYYRATTYLSQLSVPPDWQLQDDTSTVEQTIAYRRCPVFPDIPYANMPAPPPRPRRNPMGNHRAP